MKLFKKGKMVSALVTLLFTLSFTGAALADPGSPHGIEQEVDGTTVELVFKAEPLKSGKSGVIVRLSAGEHEPVENAVVNLTVQAHADEEEGAGKGGHDEPAKTPKDDHADEEDDHGDGPKTFKLKAGHAPGEYEGQVTFPSAGEWEVHVAFTVDGQEKEAVYEIEVLPGGKPWLLVGGFLGINTTIIAAAGLTRGRNPKNKELS